MISIRTYVLRLVSLMVILCLLTAIAIPLHAQDVPQSTGTISGVVRRQGTNVALALVSVRVLGTNRGTCTNGDGSYTITQIPLDTAYTIVSGDSFCTGNETLWVPEYWQETVNQENATPITLTSPAPNRTGIDFTVQRGGVVLGVVKDAAGVPLANIGVGAWDGTTWRSVCTNATGNYQIYPIPLYAAFTVEAGQDVRVECGGSLDYHREFWQEKTSYEDATRLTLTDSVVNIGGIDFTLELGGTISGRVTDTAGVPLANIAVYTERHSDGASHRYACTNANGNYTLNGVVKNEQMQVHAHGRPYDWCNSANYVEEYWQETADWGAYTPVVVTDAAPNATGINFTLAPGGTVSGRVTDTSGAALANIKVRSYGGSYYTDGCTDASGNYTFYTPLNIALVVDAADGYNWCQNGAQNYLREFWQEVSQYADATPITLAAAAPNRSAIDFTLEIGGRVDVTVAQQGRPAAPHARLETAIHVVVVPTGGGAPYADFTITTDASSMVVLNSLPFGSWDVWVKGDHTLAARATVNVVAGTVALTVGALREGDANNDNVVSITDFSILAASFGKASGTAGYDARADFNADGSVSITDFSLLAGSFGQTGVPTP